MSKPSEAYILGGGPSLLGLTEEERAYLNGHEQTLALNKYLMYWEMVGVVPQHIMQSDYATPISKIVAAETLKIRGRLQTQMVYYAHNQLVDLLTKPATLRAWVRALRYRLRFWRKNHYWLPLSVKYDSLVQIEAQVDSEEVYLASSLQQPLYHYRGSLTTAINLATILFPRADIKLLGIDMNGYSAFYELNPMPVDLPRYHRYRSYDLVKQNDHHKRSRAQDVHVTAAARDGKRGVQDVIPELRKLLQSQGRELYCCNPDSLLVVEGYCPFAPVIG